MRRGFMRWAGAGAVALATLLGAPWGVGAHDWLGLAVPPPDLPVVLVRVTGDPAVAVARAQAAGANAVWAALPEGDARLGGARPDPGTLGAGRDGRIRLAGEQRLPLPEGLGALLEVTDRQIGEGAPATSLAGRDAVLVWADPATGVRVSAPGRSAPVDRGLLLAVALGTAATGGGLTVLPVAVAAALVLLVAIAQTVAMGRRMPREALGFAAGQALVVVLIGWINRWLGVDLPVGGLLAAVVVPALLRVGEVAREALDVLDRLVTWLGPPPQDAPPLVGVAATGAMLAGWLPEARIGAWRAGGGGRPEPAGEWGEGAALPPVEALPTTADPRPSGGEGARVLPILDRGEVVGAVAVRLPDGGRSEDWALCEAVVAAGGRGAGVEALPASDPLAIRIALARAAVRRALARAERWEDLLRSAGSVVGVFDLSGALVSGSVALHALVTDADRPALLQALVALHGAGEAPVLAAVRAVVGGDRPVRLPAADGGELLLLPLHVGGGAGGVLLHRLPPAGAPVGER